MNQLITKLYQLGIRIEAKNGELQIKAPKNALTPEIVSEIKSQKENLLALLGSTETDISPAPIQEYYPLTASQKRIWILSQFEGGSKAYNIFGAFEMDGTLDYEALQKAAIHLIERHESLRTKFVQKGGDVFQKILPKKDIHFAITILQQVSDVDQVVAEFYETEFDLTTAPLLRATLIPIKPTKHILVFAIHHIIGDGWSMEIFSGELIKSYNNILNKREMDLPKLPIQYKDYAFWLESEKMQEKLKKQEKFWLSEFSGTLTKLNIPTYQPRPSVNRHKGDVVYKQFSAEWSNAVRNISEKEGATLFMTLMAGVNSILYRYGENSDIILGVPISGRNHAAVKNQIGLFLNTIAIRTQLKGEMNFLELIQLQKQKLINAYANEMYPFDQLVEKLKLERDTSRTALFDVMVVLHNQQSMTLQQSKSFEGITIQPYKKVTPKISLFDMTFSFSEYNEHVELALEYNTDLYTKKFINQLILHFQNIVNQGIKNPKKAIEKLQILAENEREELLITGKTIAYQTELTLVDIVEETVLNSFNHTALLVGDEALSYKEFNQKINQFARYLSEKHSIKKGNYIGVKLNRTQFLPIALLAVLKLGATYVPIDPSYPIDRINYILNDSNCSYVVNQETIDDFLKKKDDFSVENLNTNINASDVAYIIYTSGTTGNPKGVMITHKNANAMLSWAKNEFETENFDIVYAVTSHCFDLSVFELFFPLSVGKTIRLLPNALAILQTIEKDKKVLLNTVPSSMRSLIESNMNFDNIAMVNLAGESFPADIAAILLTKKAQIRNLYGPSEDTTYSTVYKLDAQKSYKNSVPIGKPIANTTVYILDKNLQLIPKGVIGRLYLAGDGVSMGYLGKDLETKKKFIENPFKKGTLMYDTGDLALWREDGHISFQGREDNQVKIRGYRIELEEIETAILTSSECISQVVVLVKKHENHQVLVAYYTANDTVDSSLIKHQLAETLPSYMIPSHINILEEIPLTPNGKIDRNALEKLKISIAENFEYIAPRNAIEEDLSHIWKNVLGVEKVGVTNNFFELGGHSLLAIKLINEINEKFEKTNFHIQNLFKNITIENMAALIAIAENKKDVEDFNNEDTENFLI